MSARSAGNDETIATAELGMKSPQLESMVALPMLAEFVASASRLFGVSVSVASKTGTLLAGSAPSQLLVRPIRIGPPQEETTHSGERYVVGALEHNQEVLGRILLGPLDLPTPRAKAILEHLTVSLSLILHSGERALYASTMHLASIQESYRELESRNADLVEAYARLKELDHLKSSFLATISHELRTPLTSIIGYSEMLSEGIGGPLAREQLEFVQTIRLKSDQLLSLIMSLLDLSKLESGTLSMRVSAVPIDAIVGDAITTAMPKAVKKGVRLTQQRQALSPLVRADADRIRQVFVNLVDNAVKFTPTGGEVTISVRETDAPLGDDAGLVLMAPVNKQVEVRVADTGIGIAPHERARIFDPFFQVDQSSTREQGGAGLGLAIVKRIVDAHEGKIAVEQNQPKGTVFVVSLPSGDRPSVTRPRVG